MPTDKTFIGSNMEFCSWQDLAYTHDSNVIGQLLSLDNATTVAEIDFAANTLLTKAIRWASAQIERACYLGGRYTKDDLESLEDLNLDGLKQLTADLAFWHLWKRRHQDAKIEQVAGAKEAFDTLQELKVGLAIWPYQENVDADNQSTATQTQCEDPLAISSLARRLYGQRGRNLARRDPSQWYP